MKYSVIVGSLGLLAAAAGTAICAPPQAAESTNAAATVAAPAAAGTAAPAPAKAPAMTPVVLPTVAPEILRSVAALAGGGVTAADVRPTPVAGVFEIKRASDIIYMSQDGRWVFTGDLFNVSSRTNMTDVRRAEIRKQLIDAMPESKMVVFSPPQPKYTITVFTDVDCPYCRTMHRQIADYNKLGIRVRYMFFPRSGPDTESWHKAEQIWCSTDRKTALTQAKLGKELPAKVCANTPVAQEYELGRQIGLEGTPGIVAANGTMIGGYMPPDEMLEQLKQLQP